MFAILAKEPAVREMSLERMYVYPCHRVISIRLLTVMIFAQPSKDSLNSIVNILAPTEGKRYNM